MSKLYGYARVSTRDQNITEQVKRLEAYRVPKENIFQEKLSGKSKDRPELQKCLERLEKGDRLIVTKIDRLARSLRDLTTIVGDLVERGVTIRFLDNDLNLNDSYGRFMLNVLGAVAEFEREMIVERTKEGIKAAQDRGVQFGKRQKQKTIYQFEHAEKLIDAGFSTKEACKRAGISRAWYYEMKKGREILPPLNNR